MQFRIRTLLVVVTILALMLAFSSGSEPSRRGGVLVAVCGVWMASGLTIQSLRGLTPALRLSRLALVCFSMLLVACALSATVCLTGLVLYDQWVPRDVR
jgi:hypothetical protein